MKGASMYKVQIVALTFLVSGCGAAPRTVEVVEEVNTEMPVAPAKKAGNNLIALENEAQLNDLIASGTLVVVDFFATWCGPCRQFGPVFEQVSSEFPNITFVKVDSDQFNELVKSYGVQ